MVIPTKLLMFYETTGDLSQLLPCWKIWGITVSLNIKMNRSDPLNEVF